MYAFIVGFNEWVLKGWVAGQGWKRNKSKDANGWEHDGQIIRELKAPEALAGMSGRNCLLIVVKPERRGGYMPSSVMTSALRKRSDAASTKNRTPRRPFAKSCATPCSPKRASACRPRPRFRPKRFTHITRRTPRNFASRSGAASRRS